MNAIQTFRTRLGLTRVEFASAIGVTQAAVYKHEHGKSKPAPDTAWRMVWLARANRMRLKLEDIYPEPDA